MVVADLLYWLPWKSRPFRPALRCKSNGLQPRCHADIRNCGIVLSQNLWVLCQTIFAMSPRVLALLLCSVFFLTRPASAADSDKPQEVTIQAGKYQLHGCYWTPDGPGPYPVMIFNHGSERNPAPCGPPDLGHFYQKKGYAFFTFQRHGHGASPGDYIMDLQKQAYLAHPFNRSAAESEAVGLQELYNKDVEAAVAWLKEQKWADTQHIAMTGISFSGAQTLLPAEKGLWIKAFLPFAPAPHSRNPLLAH